MKKIKIAQIGTGHDHSTACWPCLNKNSDIFDVVGIAEPIEKNKRNLENKIFAGAKIVTVEELLAMDDLDAVAIEAGKENEVLYGQMFADKGIAVFIDKPGSSNMAAWEKFVTTMKEKNLPLLVGYMYRFNPMVQKTLAMVKNGELGEIFSVEAQMSVRHDTAKRQWLARYKGGMMYFLGCHLVDMICQFQGFPKEVIPYSCCTGNEGVDAEDYGFAVFKYDNGVSFAKTCASEVNGFDRRQLVISGTKGTMEIRPWEVHVGGLQITTAKETILDPSKSQWCDSSTPVTSEKHHRYEPMMRHFAAMVRGEAEPLVSYDYEIELFRHVCMACGSEDIYRPERA